MRIHHTTGASLFPCKKCEETFETHQDLKMHARIHIGERPFKCDQCDRDFAREIMLTLHKAQHSKTDMETILDKSLESQRKRKFLVTKQDGGFVVTTAGSSRKKNINHGANIVVVDKFDEIPNAFGDELIQQQEIIME